MRFLPISEYLTGLLRAQKRVELHGVLYDGHLPCLRVLTAAEGRELNKLWSGTGAAPRRPTKHPYSGMRRVAEAIGALPRKAGGAAAESFNLTEAAARARERGAGAPCPWGCDREGAH